MHRNSKIWAGVLITALVGSIGVFYFSKKTDIAVTPSANSATSISNTQTIRTSIADEPSAALVHLYGEAKGDRVVDLWASNFDDIKWIPAAFAKTFPGISVNLHAQLDVPSAVRATTGGGKHNVDVILTSEAIAQPLVDGLLLKAAWGEGLVRDEDIGARGHMAFTHSVAFAIAYRSDLVKTSDVPRTWEELADQRYKGKLVTNRSMFSFLCAALGSFEGEAKWYDIAQAMGEDSDIEWSGSLEQAIGSGDRPFVFAISYYLADSWKARGLPVEVTFPEPVFVTQFGSFVANEAPHPKAARLLAAWLASPDGRAARERELQGVDLRQTSDHPRALELRRAAKRIYFDTEATIKLRASLIPRMTDIVRRASR